MFIEESLTNNRYSLKAKKFNVRSFSKRINNVFLALIYTIIFILCYWLFLNHYFDYAGFEWHQKPMLFYALSVAIAIIPVLSYKKLIAISSFISLFTYIILYIPIILTFAFASTLPLLQILGIQLSFMFGMFLLFIADRIYIPFNLKETIRINGFNVVMILTIISSIYMLYIYRSNLAFVTSFDKEIYEHRALNVDLGGNIITRYLSSWLSSFMVPLCLAYGIFAKRKIHFIVGSAACVIIYMATASKGLILFPVIYLLFYFLFRKNRINKIYTIFVLSLSVFLVVMLLITNLDNVSFIISSLLMYRVIGNGGLLTLWYYNFFETHPYTYYSHINLVEMITHVYPYGYKGLGQVVGQHFGGEALNANANFWATDGIAALGLPGIFVSSFVCFFIFLILNTVTRPYNKLFLVLVFIPFVYSFLNTSLFSTMWSGGGIFLIIFFLFLNPSSNRLISNNVR